MTKKRLSRSLRSTRVELEQLDLLATFTDPVEASTYLHSNKVGLIFLNINDEGVERV